MGLEEKVEGADPHHMMLAASGATMGYMGYLLAPAAFLAMPLLGPITPILVPLLGGMAGYYMAKNVD